MYSYDVKYSIVIPTYNRHEMLARCIDCLKPEVQTQSSKHYDYDVIVSDDSSQLLAKMMIEKDYSWVTWVQGPRKGPAANRNNGAKYAQGEWLIFTDDDCLPDPQWLEAYTIAIKTEPTCQAFEGRVYVDRPKKTLAEKSPCNESGGYLWSCNFAIQKQLFNQIGGFDERFPYAAMEDVDLRFRLTQAGYQFLFVKDASVCHPWRTMTGWSELKQRQKSILIYLSIHPKQREELNSNTFFKKALIKLYRDIIVESFTIGIEGALLALLEAYMFLQTALILMKMQKSNREK